MFKSQRPHTTKGAITGGAQQASIVEGCVGSSAEDGLQTSKPRGRKRAIMRPRKDWR